MVLLMTWNRANWHIWKGGLLMSLLTRFDPFSQMWREMNRLQEEMSRWFGRPETDFRTRPGFAASYPAMNIWEDENYVYAEAELPGLKLEDLEIFVTGRDELTIKGSRQPLAEHKGVWHRQERGFGTFSRLITLPAAVDADKVEARLENGVLLIKLAKSESAKPKRITVKAD
jgi:HSP20 family protein